ncbi:MAG: Flp pilus assembly protein CpaB [Actinobacteria bacterium]|nr:Flp pilus assembly protein CpaB [Actinomycetota bacterium]
MTMKRTRSTSTKSGMRLWGIILISIVAGAAVFTYTYSVEKEAKQGQVLAPVYLAVKQIPVGTQLGTALSQGYLEKKEFPTESRPTNGVEVINSKNSSLVATQIIQPGQILLTSNFAITSGNTGSLTIPDGYLAITVSLADPARVANFLQPGSEISIFVTGQTSANSNALSSTQVLLSRVTVLGIGDQIVPNTQGVSSGNSSSLITVAATPLEAKKIIYASQNMELYFGLRTAGVDFGGSSPIGMANLITQ